MMNRRELSTSGTAAALAFSGAVTAAQAAPPAVSAKPTVGQSGVSPDSADTSNASSTATVLFQRSFAAKTPRGLATFRESLHPYRVSYCDETPGWRAAFASRTGLKQRLVPSTATCEPDAKSYLPRILGDTNSANAVVDTPEMSGAEVRMISVIDFKDGRFTRKVGSWDGPRNPGTGLRSPAGQYPYSPSGERTWQNTSPGVAAAAPESVMKYPGFGGAEGLVVK